MSAHRPAMRCGRLQQAFESGLFEPERTPQQQATLDRLEVAIRTLVVPATPEIWKQAKDEGLFDVFYDAGCVISAPTCGACLGGFMGVLGAEEKCVSSTNRNFVGRMGHPKSEVYLASPATVAASAVEGKLADPRKYL